MKNLTCDPYSLFYPDSFEGEFALRDANPMELHYKFDFSM